jgi:hypothetical protein
LNILDIIFDFIKWEFTARELAQRESNKKKQIIRKRKRINRDFILS